MELFWIMTLQWGSTARTFPGTLWVEDVPTTNASQIPDEWDIYNAVFDLAVKKLDKPYEITQEDVAVLFYSIKPMSRVKVRNV